MQKFSHFGALSKMTKYPRGHCCTEPFMIDFSIDGHSKHNFTVHIQARADGFELNHRLKRK